jgi:asparagine synthase (glutamine-hydrolysing)
MCGIAGLALARDAPPPEPRTLAKMLRALGHRGPDGTAGAIAGQVALGHRRLAVIDVAGGIQPLIEGNSVMVANAEIYNFTEIRAELPAAKFTTNSDCESALHLWRDRGPAFTNSLRGMYAMAIYDRAIGVLTLCRDPFGIKPLYTAKIPGGIAFASEPQALLAAGLARRDVLPRARTEMLQMQFSVGRRTIFPDIERVLPGEMIRIVNGEITARETTAALPAGGPERMREPEALRRLDRALMESIELHLRSDVPIGLFLSSGIDSATILAGVARHQVRVPAYTAGFDVPGIADERPEAAKLAQQAGAEHIAINITESQTLRHLPAIAACMDDPAADYAIIPTWFLARRARQDVKVILSGEGGDELFAGYGRYRTAIRPWWRGGHRMRDRGTFSGLGVLWNDKPEWRESWAKAEQAAEHHRTRLRAAQAADIAEWLPNDLLLKLDRCLMAHGVEGRTPLLDRAVADIAFRLPDYLKIPGNRGKYLLRRWLAGALPKARTHAPKQGFSVPVGAWIAQHGPRFGDLMAALPCVQEVADPGHVRALFRAASGRRQSMAAWSLLFYALWHRAHIEEIPTDADVFDFLAAK